MGREEREWKRFAAPFEQFRRYYLSCYEDRTSASARMRRVLFELEYQFLPHYFARPPAWRLWVRSLAGPRAQPDFACVGPPKGGTTDLCAALVQHPAVLAPLTKEITEPDPAYWPVHYPTLSEKARAEREQGRVLCGIFTPRLHQPAFLEAFHRLRSQGKVVVILRDPVDRAFSHYKWDLFLGGMRLREYPFYRSFDAYVEAALALFPGPPLSSYHGHPLLQCGIYATSVRLWRERFGAENVYVMRAEDFFRDPAAAAVGVHQFLGLSPVPPDTYRVVLRNPIEVAPPRPETRDRLRAFYRPWNEQLYAMLGRDLEWA